MTQYLFTVIKPDGVQMGKTFEIIERHLAEGLRIVDAAFVPAAPLRQFEQLYKANIAAAHSGLRPSTEWWCAGDLYRMGPVVTVLYAVPVLSDVLRRRLKGPADPYDGQPGELRFDLGAANKALNLLHSSDSSSEARAEFAIFFPNIDFEAIVSDAEWEPADDQLGAFARQMAGFCLAEKRVDIDVFRTLLRCKRYLLEIDAQAHPAAPRGGRLQDLYLQFEDISRRGNQPDRFREFFAAMRAEASLLDAATVRDPAIRRALLDIADPSRWCTNLSDRIVGLISTSGACMTRWERLTIATTFLFPPRGSRCELPEARAE